MHKGYALVGEEGMEDTSGIQPANAQTDAQQQINVGVIGYGNLSRDKLVPAAENNEYLNVVAGADPKFEQDETVKDAFEDGFDSTTYAFHTDMLAGQDDLDAVIIASPHTYHYGQVKDSKDAGLNVFVEKPMVIDIEDAVDLYNDDMDSETVLDVGYPRHHHPAYNQSREWINDGKIGRPKHVSALLEQPGWDAHADGTWRKEKEVSGGGQIYDTGQHLLDGLLYATDSTPRHVSGDVLHEEEDIDVDSSLSLLLEHERGDDPAAIFDADVEIRGRPDDSDDAPSAAYHPKEVDEMLEIYGEEGKIVYAGNELSLWAYDEETVETVADQDIELYDVGDEHLLQNEPVVRETYDVDDTDLIQREMDNFAAAIRGEETNNATAEYGMWPVIIAESVYEANDTETDIPVAEQVEGTRLYAGD